MKEILFALWFFLPAGIANMSPILVANLPGLKRLKAPMDFGLTFRGQRVFGTHKTWRGFVVGIIAATLVLATTVSAAEEDHDDARSRSACCSRRPARRSTDPVRMRPLFPLRK